MNALWKVGEFRYCGKIELVLATADKIEAYEKHESFVRWVYAHYEPTGVGRYIDGQYWFPQPDVERFGLAVADARVKRLGLATDAFEACVHQRLDAMGVPESEHGVGGRLDWVEARLPTATMQAGEV